MRRIDGKRGAVLPLVLGILLSVTLLLTSLLQVPWGIRAVTKRFLLDQAPEDDRISGGKETP